MTRIPSADRIEAVCGVDRATAIKIRRILDGRDDPQDMPEIQKLVSSWYHAPDGRTDDTLRLEACNVLLDTYGVEAINAGWHGGYYGDIAALYCNTGDAYNGTVLYDVERDAYYVTSWGDWVETAESAGRYTFS